MIHNKTFYSMELKTPLAKLIIEGPVPADKIANYNFHEDLKTFRTPKKQHKALVEIARLPEGRIILARDANLIIGYVTFHYPDPFERWSEGNMDNLIELGAIEVVPKYRGYQVAKNLLKVAMMDDAMEDYIILTTEYYWHWDLTGTELDIWRYRKVMEKVMNAGGLECFATDDPEISAHPANCLMVRIGNRVPQEAIIQFDKLRFKNNFVH
ncbi:acetoin dehydrogenase [Vulcanibacillus modesticaldus]|uniref:Acetoin dehydrogenase n=1 Tax=Vulcanibacillus modesticaldus TaxID=337097 RepID=A0A1D2YRW2_9BACI|nr:GNAT family N-acetyltransferase [Vulcanibacillus modesticaldus]OEF95548.1 acetoin dehydrogenase [Vulcanibacillus modesticaldus]